MKNEGFMLGLIAVLSLVFSSIVYAENGAPVSEEQEPSELSKQDPPQIESTNAKKSPIESEVKADAEGKSDSGLRNEGEALKPLDLSIPFQANEDTGLKNEQNQAVQRKAPNLFSSVKNKQQGLKLDGGFLMSQEPEAEKKKSLDGAGIRLNLNP